MPAKSKQQLKFIYANRKKYGSRKNAPKHMKWIFGKEWTDGIKMNSLPTRVMNFKSFTESLNFNKKYYKVVTSNLKSLGLRKNPTIMNFPINKWIFEPNPTKDQGGWGGTGGIWVANSLSAGKGLLKYLNKKAIKENNPEFMNCRLFEVEIGDILYSNSYRTKTDKVKLIKEIS